MAGRAALGAVTMTEHDDDIEIVTERFERRLSEECGTLRVEIVTLRADTREGFGSVRTEIVERNAELLKWGLMFAVTQTGVLLAFIALFR